MKKKGIATLALAGALAATMVPAFAASNQTTVGYTANGNASIDGDVMVTVPKNVTFTDKVNTVSKFDVTAYVWKDNAWVAVDTTNTLAKSITVSVASANGYKLKTASSAFTDTEITYTYTADNVKVTGGADEAKEIGTLTGEKGTVLGSLQMGTAPTLPNDAGHVYFGDTLTYSFDGLDKPQAP